MSHLNFIVLVMDAVRASSLSIYGNPVQTTPNLDAFAADNLFFRRAFSTSTWTVPTHASLLTGLYLSQHRLESIKTDRAFNKAIVTLPQALRTNHYHTGAYSQNFLFDPAHHLADSFDAFFPLWDEERRQSQSDGFKSLFNGNYKRWQMLDRYWKKMSSLRRGFDLILQHLTSRDDGNALFLMANFTGAHYPWAPPIDILWRYLGPEIRYLYKQEFVTPSPFRINSGMYEVSDLHRRIWHCLYEAAIQHIDQEFGRFLDRLRRWSGWSNTVLIITADHGEMLGEHNGIVGHMLSLNDHLIHVPLIMRHPDYQGGTAIDAVTQTLDIYPSILEWAEVATGQIPVAQRQRMPLSAVIAKPSDCGGLAFAEEDYTDSYNPIKGLLKVNPQMDPRKYPRQQIAVRSATHKYIWFDDRPGEFYDLIADSAEAHNLTDTIEVEERNILETLQKSLADWRTNLEIFPPRTVVDPAHIEPDMIERLQSLGYVS